MRQNIKHANNIMRPLKALYCAAHGLKIIFQEEVSFRQEIFLTFIVIPLALFLGATSIEKAILVGCWFLVLLTEIINSSIEAIVDRISLEIHPLSKKIKDMGSAAVLLSIVNLIVVWLIILVNH